MAVDSVACSRHVGMHYIYPFGADAAVPPLDKNLLGGKGKGLAEMSSIGLPVPPGLIITTEACQAYLKGGQKFPAGLQESLEIALNQLEQGMQRRFGGQENPLLLSVRSGARVSMPGMMDTILNLGLNDDTVVAFAKAFKDEKFAYDNYRRFIMMYADVVAGVGRHLFEQAFDAIRIEENVSSQADISVDGLKKACLQFKKIYEKHQNSPFPQDAKEQLFKAIEAVFNSWNCERAKLYRQIHRIPEDWGTAVNVQAMVFGNRNQASATGVCFTRDPATGENQFYGEFLLNAQGEEVVAGIRTPHPINCYQKKISSSELACLEEILPEAYKQLFAIVKRLEAHYADMQDIEFTIEDRRLYILQTRTGKRTGFAAVRMAVEMLQEGLIDEKTALKRVLPDQLGQLLAPIFNVSAKKAALHKMVAKGLNAGPGAASGVAAFSAEKAVAFKEKGVASILIREEANPDDFAGMVAADGILTLRGGSTSHAAVVARGMGKPCIVGCGSLTLNEHTKMLSAGHMCIQEGDSMSIDGTTGEVFFCDLPTSPSEVVQVLISAEKKPVESLIYQHYKILMDIADKYRRMHVRANADTAADSCAARAFGAEGIGLCRTEHMFMNTARLNDVRRMLFSQHSDERRQAVARLLPHQKQDFIEIFRAMHGLPVTIRLLDPPLHEFMPHTDDELVALSEWMKVPVARLAEIRAGLQEQNPMLGYRGCRLGVTMPELTAMQARAILEAAVEVTQEGINVYPEIMFPLIACKNEFTHQRLCVEMVAEEVFKAKGMSVPYAIGSMIELPRTALVAGELAEEADFFSFGTNDLTQTTFGISRDDGAHFMPAYVHGTPLPGTSGELFQIMAEDPFQVIDRTGVGELMYMAMARAKRTKPAIKFGLCGEHGGEPRSIAFCHELGLNYISCSPYRVPIARLAAAQNSLEEVQMPGRVAR